MKWFILFAAFFLVISCSDSDKFSGEKKQQISIEGIGYDIYDGNLLGFLQTEIKNCVSRVNTSEGCYGNNCWIINGGKYGKYSYVSLKNLDACYLSDYLWIVDDDTIPSSEESYKVNYGEHFVKLVLVDIFGDSISYDDSLQIDEPIKITLLSPVDNYEALKTEKIKFQYHISGTAWEEGKWEDTVDIVCVPANNKLACDWRVKLYNQDEDDTIYSQERRKVWIEN